MALTQESFCEYCKIFKKQLFLFKTSSGCFYVYSKEKRRGKHGTKGGKIFQIKEQKMKTFDLTSTCKFWCYNRNTNITISILKIILFLSYFFFQFFFFFCDSCVFIFCVFISSDRQKNVTSRIY